MTLLNFDVSSGDLDPFFFNDKLVSYQIDEFTHGRVISMMESGQC